MLTRWQTSLKQQDGITPISSWSSCHSKISKGKCRPLTVNTFPKRPMKPAVVIFRLLALRAYRQNKIEIQPGRNFAFRKQPVRTCVFLNKTAASNQNIISKNRGQCLNSKERSIFREPQSYAQKKRKFRREQNIIYKNESSVPSGS